MWRESAPLIEAAPGPVAATLRAEIARYDFERARLTLRAARRDASASRPTV